VEEGGRDIHRGAAEAWRIMNAERRSPIAKILFRYLVSEFLRIVALCLVAFIVVYLIADFSDRIDDFLKHQAPVGAIVRYFLVRIPLIVNQVLPIAVLAAMLLSLGGFSRHNELTAMRACGLSSAQIVAPLLGVCLMLSAGVFVWNEKVVPYFATRAHYINTIEIKKRQMQGLLGDQQIWAHGQDTFYNIQSFDARSRTLVGITIYPIDPEFHLKGLFEIPQARWNGKRWAFHEGVGRVFAADGDIQTVALAPGTLDLREKPADLMAARRDAEEFSYSELKALIDNLRKKGLDTTEYLVDLDLKLAVPFVCTVMALISMPLGMRNLRSSSLANNIGLGLLIGASYWFVLALAVSLGHSGALPPVVAAWTANAIFAAIGIFLLLGAV
jgi:lipopolysaccharide export system permease protein